MAASTNVHALHNNNKVRDIRFTGASICFWHPHTPTSGLGVMIATGIAVYALTMAVLNYRVLSVLQESPQVLIEYTEINE